jgi:hypothetical protein
MKTKMSLLLLHPYYSLLREDFAIMAYKRLFQTVRKVGIPRVDPRIQWLNPQASSVPLPHGTHGPR